MRIFLLSRHGESLFNVAGVVNADPSLDRGLSGTGQAEAKTLGDQISGLDIDLAITSEFPRAQETAAIALAGRDVPRIVWADLNDVRIGELEGKTLADYRTWKRAHPRSDRFPGGESLDDAATRYARAYHALLARPEQTIFVVCHEIPIRYAVNAARGSAQLDAPVHDVQNAVPYLLGERQLEASVAGIERLAVTHA